MNDPRIDKLSRLIVEYSTAVKPGEIVLIEGESGVQEMVEALYRDVLKAGGQPRTHLTFPGQQRLFYEYATDEQLDAVPAITRAIAEIIHVYIVVWADANTRELTMVDSQLIARHRRAQRPIRDIMDRREREGVFRWCGVGYPSQGNAQDADMSLFDYRNFVFGAALVDEDDPVAAWQNVSRRQEQAVQRLNGTRSLRFVGPRTDITVDVTGRRWINCDGHFNCPDGEVFTSPVEGGTEGHIWFSYPAVYSGNEVEDVYLEFKAGKVVNARAGKGEKFLLDMLDMDDGARFLGEVAFGLNYGIQRFTKNILYDEKIGGTVHFALGASYPETGGQNRSSLHWDMIKDMKQGSEVFADGDLVYRDGEFVFET